MPSLPELCRWVLALVLLYTPPPFLHTSPSFYSLQSMIAFPAPLHFVLIFDILKQSYVAQCVLDFAVCTRLALNLL